MERTLAVDGGPWPTTQDFGCTQVAFEPPNPACPSGHYHTGIDIGAWCGTAVRAIWDGTVLAPDQLQAGDGCPIVPVSYPACCEAGCLGGQMVQLRSCDGRWDAWYGHLEAAAVTSGTQVSRGQVLGYVGTRGCSTGPHLHFEVQQAGTRLFSLEARDPTPFLIDPAGVTCRLPPPPPPPPPAPPPQPPPPSGGPPPQPSSSPDSVLAAWLLLGGAVAAGAWELHRLERHRAPIKPLNRGHLSTSGERLLKTRPGHPHARGIPTFRLRRG